MKNEDYFQNSCSAKSEASQHGVSFLMRPWILSVNLFASALVSSLCLFSQPALGVEAEVSPKTRYEQALRRIKTSGVLDKTEVSIDFFASLDWVGKTALINLVCHSASSNSSLCQSVVNQGLTDEALVIRDHALRTVLADRSLSGTVKETVAQKIVDDDRNYRKGKAFWIVQNAQSYLRLLRKKEPVADE